MLGPRDKQTAPVVSDNRSKNNDESGEKFSNINKAALRKI